MKGLIEGTTNHRLREMEKAERLRDCAPELLEVLRGLAQSIQDGRQWVEPVEGTKSWLRVAFAAIEKAEGK